MAAEIIYDSSNTPVRVSVTSDASEGLNDAVLSALTEAGWSTSEDLDSACWEAGEAADEQVCFLDRNALRRGEITMAIMPSQITALRREAEEHGDLRQAAICMVALGASPSEAEPGTALAECGLTEDEAWAECERVINAWAAERLAR